MKLQLALDMLHIEEALSLLAEIADVVDIVEIGTPLIMKEGIKAVSVIKQAYPQLDVLADLKIVDAGKLEAQIAIDAGADIVTVLGLAHNTTIQQVLGQAHKHGRQVMVDLLAVSDVQARARELEMMNVDYVCVHTAFDVQSQQNPLQELKQVKQVLKQTKTAVAGGIKPDTLPEIVTFRPDVVVVGGYVVNHKNKRQAALEIKKWIG
jgi:3-hexulose-6-phosphate synthase